MAARETPRVQSTAILRGTDTGDEENFPAEQPQAAQNPRLPRPHAHDRRSERPEEETTEGPKEARRLKKGPSKSRFDLVFREGQRVNANHCRLAAAPGSGHVGFATSKKIGSQPRRNRIKRRFREAIRERPQLVSPSLDYVLVILPSADKAPAKDLVADLESVFGRMQERWEKQSGSS